MDEIKILLIGNDKKILTLTTDVLGQPGHVKYSVHACPTPSEALGKMAAGGYDACLIDHNQGEGTGLDLLKEAKDKGCNNLPIVLINGRGDNGVSEEALKLGATDCLTRDEIIRAVLERSIRYSIAQKKLELKLMELSLKDGLTGLANRRYFDEAIEKEWRRAFRDELMISLILIDIDYFKHFNDTYGCIAGDRCLQSVSAAVARCVNRPGDLVARIGGEEIAVILPETDAFNAKELGERMRESVLDLNIPHAGSKVEDCQIVSISGGIVTMELREFQECADLIQRAEEELYVAKEMGRNRMVSA